MEFNVEVIGMVNRIDEYAKALERKIEERTKELDLLVKINTALNRNAALNEILQLLADGLKEAFDYDGCTVFLLSDDKKHLVLRNVAIDSKFLRIYESVTGFKAIGYKIPLFEGSEYKKMIETKEPWILPPDSARVFWSQWTDNPKLKYLPKLLARVDPRAKVNSTLTIPLVARKMVVGAIGISTPRGMSEDDLRRLMSFGEQAGLAIQQAKLYERWLKEEDLRGYLEKTKKIVNGSKVRD